MINNIYETSFILSLIISSRIQGVGKLLKTHLVIAQCFAVVVDGYAFLRDLDIFSHKHSSCWWFHPTPRLSLLQASLLDISPILRRLPHRAGEKNMKNLIVSVCLLLFSLFTYCFYLHVQTSRTQAIATVLASPTQLGNFYQVQALQLATAGFSFSEICKHLYANPTPENLRAK